MRMADAQTWSKRVAAWRASGQTASEFASGRAYAASTLRWWASQLGRRDVGFVRVVAAPSPVAAPDAAIEVEVGGMRVLVRAGFDRATLADVLDVLRGGGPS